MIDRTLTRRSDEQLEYMLHETTNWTVTSTNGKTLCEVASLYCAVEQAVDFGALGHRIVALIREREPEIVLFSGQIRTLINRLFDPDDYQVVSMP
jgi:hypothetical protein